MNKVERVKELLGLSKDTDPEDLEDHTQEIIEEVKEDKTKRG